MIQNVKEYVDEYRRAGRHEIDRVSAALREQGVDEEDVLTPTVRLLVDLAVRARVVVGRIYRKNGEYDYKGVGEDIIDLVESELEAVLSTYPRDTREELSQKAHFEAVQMTVRIVRDVRRDDFVRSKTYVPAFAVPILEAIHEVEKTTRTLTYDEVNQVRRETMRRLPMRPDPDKKTIRAVVLEVINQAEFDVSSN